MNPQTLYSGTTPQVEEALIPYLSHRYTRGQFDRSVGLSEGEIRTRAQGMMRDYIESQESKWEELAPKVERYLGRRPARILDVGSSIGNAVYVLSHRYPEAQIVGCEIEAEAIAVARQLTSSRRNVNYILSGIEDLGCADGHFDFIHCACVIEHVMSPPQAIKRMVDLLAPGGVLSLGCPNYIFPYEGHLRCWMLPGGPRWLLKLRCLLRGENSAFVDDIRLDVNILRVKRWLKRAGRVEWLDLNGAKIDSILLEDRGDGVRAPGLVAWIKRMRLAGFAAWLLRNMPVAPSVALLVRKIP